MNPLFAFQQAVRDAHAFRYAWDKLALLKDSLVDVLPWMTPAEVQAAGAGLCRDLAIFACDETAKLSPGVDVRLVLGQLKGDDGTVLGGHAWVELVLGRPDVVYWGDPTNDSVIAPREHFPSLIPEKAERYDGRQFVEEFDYREVPA